ncbi:MFS transporter [Amycolatopsis sp. SID8362]|uniref:MFS transporter n=1 Tax=Amycolatopsis sp. SID8362 TaxID=2690346 RepID=UPI00136FC875|nr:MFS transporter [Amycolatopsis sp. SID8362]NBH06351.1 MFS transporter [Amycolatopsis sp. SID8362]NED43049.1 MFS transporter [Amycolatopsis sp. SID8362]
MVDADGREEVVSPGIGAAPADTASRAEISARRRGMMALFTTATLMNAAMAAVAPTSTIWAEPYVGVMWSAFPQTLTILGTGLGALLLVRATSWLGWRASLMVAFAVGTLGGLICFTATLIESIPLLDGGMFVLGLGVGGSIVSRYAAAELYPAHRSGYALGLVVAAGAVGSVGGPLLLYPMSSLMGSFGLPELSGPFLLAAVVSAVAGLGGITLPRHKAPRPTGSQLAVLGSVFRSGSARMLLLVMIVSQLIMVAIMTAAPMDIILKDGTLVVVGAALAAHAGGMFVFAPLTGWMIDRIGARKVMFAGLAVLVLAAAIGAGSTMSHTVVGSISLFLLGYGWNLGFMAGSRTLATTLSSNGQGQVVGAVDAVVWCVSATGTIGGTALLGAGGYSIMAEIMGILPIVTFLLLLRSRPVAAVSPAAAPAAAAGAPERTDEAA